MYRLVVLALLLTAPACKKEAGPTPAASVDRDLIGTRTVTFRQDRDVIRATTEGRFSAIRVIVTGAPIAVSQVRITFANGDTHVFDGPVKFKEGSMTRRLDLPGQRRVIRSIDFRYRTLLKGAERATVRVVGIR